MSRLDRFLDNPTTTENESFNNQRNTTPIVNSLLRRILQEYASNSRWANFFHPNRTWKNEVNTVLANYRTDEQLISGLAELISGLEIEGEKYFNRASSSLQRKLLTIGIDLVKEIDNVQNTSLESYESHTDTNEPQFNRK